MARVVAVGAAIVMGCHRDRAAPAAGARVEAALRDTRFTVGQLADAARWEPCVVDASTPSLVPTTRCGGPPRDASTYGSADLGAWLRTDSSPRALRTGALLDLRWRDASPGAVGRAVAALERARSAAPGDAALLNDLAVAYLALAEREQTLDPLLRALDAVERARAVDARLLAARFNRALVLERLSLIEAARDAWTDYLTVERRPAWDGEARAHLGDLTAVLDGVTDPSAAPGGHPGTGDRSTAADVGRLVARSPQDARERGLAALGAWGAAVGQHDAAGAARAVSAARNVATALASIPADQSVALALARVEALAADGRRTVTLARAHRDLADGFALQARAAYDDAAQRLGSAERALHALHSPAAGWAAVYLGISEIFLGRYAEADAAFRRARAAAAPAQPALVGKALWGLGLSQLRQGAYDAATRWYADAAPHFVDAHEAENQGAVAYLRTEALMFAGRPDAGNGDALRALQTLAPFRGSSYLEFHLANVATYARGLELPAAALTVMGEAVAVADRLPRPHVAAFAHLSRARLLIGLGRLTDARAELRASLAWAARVQPGRGRERARADAQLALAQITRTTDPRATLALLAPVTEIYRSLGTDGYLVRALDERARAARGVGDVAAAHAYLRDAVAVIEHQRRASESAESRAMLYESVEHVFDALADLDLASARPDSAFADVERGRTAVWYAGRLGAGPAALASPSLGTIGRRLPRDALFVEYALLPDRIAVWSAARSGSAYHEVPVSRDSVAALVERFLRESDAGAAERPGRPAGPGARLRLSSLLLGPLAAKLRDVRRLIVVPDRELARVPFAALRDPATGRYVVEDVEVRTLPTAAFLSAPAARTRRRAAGGAMSGTVLVVGEPAADSAGGVALVPLPNAAREARRVAHLYHGARLLSGAQAERHAVLALLPTAEVFHFAGHAVGDATHPDRSFLAFAHDRTPGAVRDGALRAGEIDALRLSNLRLVVLAACSTLNGRPSRMGAVAGLAYSFLRAGVPATISTLWDVDDAVTADVLVAFHERFAAGDDAAAALRAAQLGALRSARAELRAPRAWAAFVYTGP